MLLFRCFSEYSEDTGFMCMFHTSMVASNNMVQVLKAQLLQVHPGDYLLFVGQSAVGVVDRLKTPAQHDGAPSRYSTSMNQKQHSKLCFVIWNPKNKTNYSCLFVMNKGVGVVQEVVCMLP